MTNGNHPNALRKKMVRVEFMCPEDITDEIRRRAQADPEETWSSIARRLIRRGLAAEAAA